MILVYWSEIYADPFKLYPIEYYCNIPVSKVHIKVMEYK